MIRCHESLTSRSPVDLGVPLEGRLQGPVCAIWVDLFLGRHHLMTQIYSVGTDNPPTYSSRLKCWWTVLVQPSRQWRSSRVVQYDCPWRSGLLFGCRPDLHSCHTVCRRIIAFVGDNTVWDKRPAFSLYEDFTQEDAIHRSLQVAVVCANTWCCRRLYSHFSVYLCRAFVWCLCLCCGWLQLCCQCLKMCIHKLHVLCL